MENDVVGLATLLLRLHVRQERQQEKKRPDANFFLPPVEHLLSKYAHNAVTLSTYRSCSGETPQKTARKSPAFNLD